MGSVVGLGLAEFLARFDSRLGVRVRVRVRVRVGVRDRGWVGLRPCPRLDTTRECFLARTIAKP